MKTRDTLTSKRRRLAESEKKSGADQAERAQVQQTKRNSMIQFGHHAGGRFILDTVEREIFFCSNFFFFSFATAAGTDGRGPLTLPACRSKLGCQGRERRTCAARSPGAVVPPRTPPPSSCGKIERLADACRRRVPGLNRLPPFLIWVLGLLYWWVFSSHSLLSSLLFLSLSLSLFLQLNFISTPLLCEPEREWTSQEDCAVVRDAQRISPRPGAWIPLPSVLQCFDTKRTKEDIV